ncbi:MAG: isochorismatase family protein [Agathobacter sp.]|nr:isochorismatase family protein [Agathobacter sp.]
MNNDLLLVIDMQNVYLEGEEWACLDTLGTANRINQIIASKKCKNVIFTKYIASKNPVGVWKQYNTENATINNTPWLNEMVEPLKKWEGTYPFYEKSTYSSLTVPEVLEAAKNADRVIVTGVVAECCVLSTVMALIDAGIYTVYLTDGVSGLDTPKEDATKLILSGLSPLHVDLMTVEEYLHEEDK